MRRFLVFAALISITHVVESKPQSFGQSFSSSSVVKPNGQVVSSSIYTDSKGNRVVNGQKPTFLKIPTISNDLLPPFIPGEFLPLFVQKPLPPLIQPLQVAIQTTSRPSSAPVTTRTTSRPSSAPITTRTTTRASSIVKRVTLPPATRTPSAINQAKLAVNNPNGIREGAYVHDNAGAYQHDDRGKYLSK